MKKKKGEMKTLKEEMKIEKEDTEKERYTGPGGRPLVHQQRPGA